MNGIQLLLIGGVAVILTYYISKFRSAFFDLLIVFAFSVLGVFFILSPETTNLLAKKLGVGRGADLLFYCCILFFLFIIIKLFSRISRLENKITEIVRQQAIDEVKLPVIEDSNQQKPQ